MTAPTAITVDHVSKKYRLFASKRDRLREVLDPWRRSFHREFWALKDVNLAIARGHTVGILGMNGSGKSTLLQIISSVLQPTSGTVHVDGKVAALLELGAGFNPELTGRENVILNGTIMGLRRDEISACMPAIEAFADIGEFFDQPMKTCSSGMFMRVAFATAIYVDPDILIIDEALSVGDAKFQGKCFRRFQSFQAAGKTILFVTHDRSAIPRYCDLGILLHEGRVVEVGEPGRIADLYGELLTSGTVRRDAVSSSSTVTAQVDDTALGAVNAGDPVAAFVEDRSIIDRCASNPTYNKYEHRFGNRHAQIVDYVVVDGHAVNPSTVHSGARVDICFRVAFHQTVETPIVGIIVKNKEGVIAYGVNTEWMNQRLERGEVSQTQTYRFRIQLNLAAGDWFIDLAVAESITELCDDRGALIHIYVMDRGQYVGLARLETSFEALHVDTGGAHRLAAPVHAPPARRSASPTG